VAYKLPAPASQKSRTLTALTAPQPTPSGGDSDQPARALTRAERFRRVVRQLGPTSILAVGAAVLPPLGTIVLIATAPTTSAWLREHPDIGPLVYTLCFGLLAGLALLPTYAQSILGGLAFGVAIGLPAALGGFALGAIIGYEIASRVSGDRVKKLVEERPKFAAVHRALIGSAVPGRGGFWKTFLVVTLLRVPPNSPFAIMNLLMASVKVPRLPFILGTAIGMLPRTAVAVVVGAGLDRITSETLKPPGWVFVGGLVATIAVVLVIGTMANRVLARIANAAPPPSPS
jgi:uncharacterized membrane protein YdjX (TVP38/TMEM64 family)